ncbi:MAG: hypothetical protein OEM00_11170, partial [Burkholderiaceae bacterium]|nr:hypothetical protein [Burkholderiaceae bacterium]
GARTVSGIATVRNIGSTDLTITDIRMAEGAGAFSVTGSAANVTVAAPLVLAPGASADVDVLFDPSQIGLIRGALEFASNDTDEAVKRVALVGTGTGPLSSTLDWGNDYVALETPGQANSQPLRTVSEANGYWSFFLPSDEALHYVVFDPVSGLIMHGYDVSASNGATTSLTGGVFAASTANDSDFDGLPDDIEFAIGTNPANKDTDKDGLDDFTEIQQGLDPLGGLGIPTGVVAAVGLQGSAQAVAVAGALGGTPGLTALVATGTYGLATVDAAQFTKPKLLAELDLPGTNTDVAVDALRGLAVVAGNEAGLHLVDVSDPMTPQLLQTIAFSKPVTRVEVRDGIAFVATGSDIATVDLNTGDVRATLSPAGGATLVDIALEGDMLYSIDSARTLRSVSVAGSALTLRDSLTLPAGGGKLFVGGGVAYIGASSGGQGGYLTADVSDPDDIQLLSGVDNNAVAGTAIALNGSGLAVGVGNNSFVFGGFKALDVFSAADPADTGNFLTRIDLPEVPRDLVLANGLAFVADGDGGLQIVNYIGFDTLGVAPTVSISADGVDADPGTPGVQVLEGRTVRVLPTISDDVQVRNVELLVNGQVVSTDVSFPFELFAQAPTIASGGNTLSVQVRATDTGGNVALSNVVTLDVVPDTFPPEISAISLAEGARLFFVRSIDIAFDEPLDVALLATSGVSLLRAGADGDFDTSDDVVIPVRLDTRSFGQALSIVIETILPAGDYRLIIAPTIIADNAGNELAAPVQRLFSIRPASDVQATSGVPEVPNAPSANPGQQIGIAVPFDPSTARADFMVTDASGNTTTRVVTAHRIDVALGVAFFKVPLDVVTGDAVVYAQVGSERTDFADGTFLLQILPVVTGLQVESVASDGSTAQLLIAGLGFVEGNSSEYRFGTETVLDPLTNTGPDVFGRSDSVLGFVANGYARVTVPLSDGVFGAINVKT